MNTLDVLKGARELLSDPARWTQEYYAYSEDGEMVEPDDERACSWCLIGAMWKVSGTYDTNDPEQALMSCLPVEYQAEQWPETAMFNDRASHAEVLAVLDCAIAKASA